MGRHVAFLRAINVAGHPTLRMSAVAEAFVTAGCDNVRTVIQSGNVIFDAGKMKEAAAFPAVRKELARLMGLEPVIVFRPLRELCELVQEAPFAGEETRRDVMLYVAFLSRALQERPVFPIISAREGLEAVGMRKLDVFIRSSRKANGMYGFPNNFIEDALHITATTRNWSTVRKIAALAE
jgi:uncharacterized protein (DUF1697 family)